MTALPDLYVLGAQKSGTTSLCAWLEQSEAICLAQPKEPMVLSRDDASLHPHFFAEQPQAWQALDYTRDPASLTRAYEACFAHAQPGQLRCDGSTSYLFATEVPRRIAELTPEAKCIVILRDPTARSYSAYWHYVMGGIACETFENHIRYEGGLSLRGSHYAEHIERLLQHIPRAQCLFLLYEEMRSTPEKVNQALCAFLQIDPLPPQIPSENRGQSAKSPLAQRQLNRLRRFGSTQSAAIDGAQAKSLWQQGLDWLESHNRTDARYPPMEASLHQRLDQHFRQMNERLGELTGLDVSPYWYKGPKG